VFEMEIQQDGTCYACSLKEPASAGSNPLFSTSNREGGFRESVPMLEDITPFEEIIIARAHCHL
jgi:hypothetical protein